MEDYITVLNRDGKEIKVFPSSTRS